MLQLGVCVLVAVLAVGGAADKLISKGSWRIITIGQCDDPDKYKMKFNVTKHKISRLEDAFDAGCSLPGGLDSTHSLQADIEKYTEGGWKSYQLIKDSCFLCFVEKYAHENLRQLKGQMGLDKDEANIPKGEYFIYQYVFNYCELPPDGIVGTFRATALALNPLSIPEGCVLLTLEFREEPDECGEEE